MKNKIFYIFKIILFIVSILTSLYFVKIINDLNMLPNKLFIILIVVYLMINILNILCLLSKKLLFNIFGFILTLIIICVSCFGINHGSKITNFLNETFSYDGGESITYYVVVLKDSNYNSIDDLNGLKMAYVSLDENKDESIKEMNNHMINDLVGYEEPYSMYDDLTKKKFSSFIVSEGFYELIEEYAHDMEDVVKTIYTFDIELKDDTSNEDIKELKPINVLISGSDARTKKIYSKTRSDVNMIMTIDPVNHKILLTSIPRDYYVQLHGTKGNKDKLTHSGVYGIDVTKSTIEDLFDIKIDYTLKVGFQSVIQLVDLIDGIDIDSDQAFTTHCKDGGAERTKVEKGMNHFTGAQALSYARERYAYKTGDNHRVQNQQQVLEAIVSKVTSDKSLLSKYDKLLDSLSVLYRTDIPSSYIKLLIKDQLDNMSSWSVEKQQVSGTGAMKETYSMPGLKLWVMQPDMNSVKDAKENIMLYLNKE